MGRFKLFLTEERESRSITVSEKEAISLIKKNCMDSFNSTTPIYRGAKSLVHGYYYWRNKGVRVSPYANNNIYMLLLSNLPSWKNYPQRNKSIVGTTEVGKSYGSNPFIILPFNNAKIGVCNSFDIWDSFRNTGLPNLNNLNRVIADAYHWVTNEYVGMGEPKKYNELLAILDKIDNSKELGIKNHFADINPKYFKMYFENEDVKLIDVLEEMLLPQKNKFKLAKAGDNLPSNVEVWTDSPCILVENNLYIDLKMRDYTLKRV